jgi:hypothetical protein
MTVPANDYITRTMWQGPTAPIEEKRRIIPVPELRIIKGGKDEGGKDEGGNDYSPDTSNYADDIQGLVDFSAAPMYIAHINASSSSNIDYLMPNISEAVKTSSENRPKMVSLDTVARGASFIVATISVMSLLTTATSGAIIIQPLFAIALLISCIFFYFMTLVKK